MRWLLFLAFILNALAQDAPVLWQGDIVLTPEQARPAAKGGRASAVISDLRYRWTNATIPYIIDADVPNQSRVTDAIAHWNQKTVIRLVPRTGETNYVQFRRRPGIACSSNIGMIGGRQFISLPDECTTGAIIHEIGHAVGLDHTQSREDRDIYLRVDVSELTRDAVLQYDQSIASTDDIGAYPFDSIMHYRVSDFAPPGSAVMQTIPSGIPVGQRDGLSPSDIDTVARIYGTRPTKTVIASNPSGLDVLVDGTLFRTPAEFIWPAGSRHTLRAYDSTADGVELQFARWSDFGDRAHTITASADVTVFTAHMRRLFRFPLTANPAGSGQIIQRPASENGLVPLGQAIQLEALPASGNVFANWSGTIYTYHGSISPVRIVANDPQISYSASFTRNPLTTITTNPPGLRIVVDGTTYTSPRLFAWASGSTHDISIATSPQTTLSGTATHTFRGWSDGGAQRHTITANANGGIFTADFSSTYPVSIFANPSFGGTISIIPPPNAGTLPAGSTVTITATPSFGYTFTGWASGLSGTDATQTLRIDGPLNLEAQFAQPFLLSTTAFLSGASFFSGPVAPGQIVTLFGFQLGPPELAGLTINAQRRVDTAAGGVRVLFDGTPAPMIYASGRQVAAIVPFNVANRTLTRVQLEYQGRLTNSITLQVAAAAPAFFTANSSGRGGGAFLNANGSLNTETNPADRGSIVVLYATGLGAMRPAMADGELASPPYAQPAAPYKVRIADRECEILYGGAAPGLVAGLVQLNVRVPSDIGPGVVPVTLEVAGVLSPRTVSLAVR